MNLEVDAFAIDIEVLDAAQSCRVHPLTRSVARNKIAEIVVENLSLDDKKRFEEYQEQNNPCR